MWVVYVCEFVCVNIYIYNVYICIYYYARESNDDDECVFSLRLF
jgi:regulator of replication initiation timing